MEDSDIFILDLLEISSLETICGIYDIKISPGLNKTDLIQLIVEKLKYRGIIEIVLQYFEEDLLKIALDSNKNRFKSILRIISVCSEEATFGFLYEFIQETIRKEELNLPFKQQFNKILRLTQDYLDEESMLDFYKDYLSHKELLFFIESGIEYYLLPEDGRDWHDVFDLTRVLEKAISEGLKSKDEEFRDKAERIKFLMDDFMSKSAYYKSS